MSQQRIKYLNAMMEVKKYLPFNFKRNILRIINVNMDMLTKVIDHRLQTKMVIIVNHQYQSNIQKKLRKSKEMLR